jgi:hypothetical protein
VQASHEYSGAEIEGAIVASLYDAFHGGRDVTAKTSRTTSKRWCRFPKPCTKRSRACATGLLRERGRLPSSRSQFSRT